MKFLKTKFEDVYIIEPNVLIDERGSFFESFKSNEFQKYIKDINFIFEFQSRSKKNTFRGFHYQTEPHAQSKLVNVCYGKVLDIIIDVKKNSKTFGEYMTVELSDKNNMQLFIPKGYAHGFIVLSDEAIMNYKLDAYYSPEYYTGINFEDKKLNIRLPIDKIDLLISPKDLNLPFLDDAILF